MKFIVLYIHVIRYIDSEAFRCEPFVRIIA